MNDTNTKPAAPQYRIPEWLRPHLAEVRAWGPVDGDDSLCWVEGCTRSPHLHGLCRRHYFRASEKWKRPRKRKSTPDPAGVPDVPREVTGGPTGGSR